MCGPEPQYCRAGGGSGNMRAWENDTMKTEGPSKISWRLPERNWASESFFPRLARLEVFAAISRRLLPVSLCSSRVLTQPRQASVPETAPVCPAMTDSFRVILYNKPLGGQMLARCVEEIVSVLAIVLSGCSQEAGTQWFLI